MNPIAHIRTDFPEKFGIPRQSGLVGTTGRVVFLPPYRRPESLRGLDGFSHIWLVWLFSESVRADWSPTVRPPRLGGNTRLGVFATRSPFRPNPIGLSCVKLTEIRHTADEGDVLIVEGADLLDGTPILDIKPYLPFTDCQPQATGGFAEPVKSYALTVRWAADWPLESALKAQLESLLAQDPRPSYQEDPTRVYGLRYAGYHLHFTVDGTVLTVQSLQKES